MEQNYYFRKVTARKSCYCSQCENDIKKGEIKILVYVNNPHENEYHHNGEDENGEAKVDLIQYVTLIGITHEDCYSPFKEKNKKEHSVFYDDKNQKVI